PEASIQNALIEVAKDNDTLVQLYSTFALSSVTNNPDATDALADVIEKRADEQLFRDAALSGLRNREAEFAQLLIKRPAWKDKKAGYDKVLSSLARAATFSQHPAAINTILDLAVADKTWHRDALLDGIINTTPVARGRRPAPRARPVRL